LICFSFDTDGGCVTCADGSIEGGVLWWQRSDIVFCEGAFSLTGTIAEAQMICGPNSHICTSNEFRARNDDFGGVTNVTVRIDDGENCMAHQAGVEGADDNNMAADGVRPNFAGSCTSAPYVSQAYSLQTITAEWGVYRGALCCLNGEGTEE
jgi:hypothetical protein